VKGPWRKGEAVDNNTLYQGDCISGLGHLEPGSVDLVFADPPFNIGYEYDVYEDKRSAADYLAWSKRWGEGVHRALKPNGSFWLAIGDDFAAELKLLFQRDIGFYPRSWVIWYYTFGVNCTKKFSRSHTHLFHFVKDPKKFTFNGDAIRVPSARQMVYADSRANSKGRLPDDTWFLRPHDVPEGFSPDHDTWYFARVCGTFKERAGFHGCQMPEQLLARIIRVSSNPGDLVVDPFSGSGTTLVVAKKLARNWIGFELSEQYANEIRRRLDPVYVGQSPEGPENPLQSAPKTIHGKSLGQKTVVVPSGPVIRDGLDRNKGILEAFVVTRNGFPADRVIADPELNQSFVDVCRRWGIPGTPVEWNHGLMNLRKAGFMRNLPKSKRTSFTKQEQDCCAFACEIAIQHFHDQDCSLDRLLCDPERALEFDRFVISIVNQRLPSILMRWVALGIRKRAKHVRRKALEISRSHLSLPKRRIVASEIDFSSIPEEPGLYWLRNNEDTRKLYVGETLNLHQRLEMQLDASPFEFWGTDRKHLDVRFQTLQDDRQLFGFQSYWIGRWRPQGNYCKLAAV
jgi:DNA modification methylase